MRAPVLSCWSSTPSSTPLCSTSSRSAVATPAPPLPEGAAAAKAATASSSGESAGAMTASVCVGPQRSSGTVAGQRHRTAAQRSLHLVTVPKLCSSFHFFHAAAPALCSGGRL
eukprot:1185457-Prorocentrum_minimum.AAC.2